MQGSPWFNFNQLRWLSALLGLWAAWSTALVHAQDTETRAAAARGLVWLQDRNTQCLLCHVVSGLNQKMGNLGPPLAGVGSRRTAEELRQRLIDAQAINPESIMPPYFRNQGLFNVGSAWQGQTVLSKNQLEDLVAYLQTLK